MTSPMLNTCFASNSAATFALGVVAKDYEMTGGKRMISVRHALLLRTCLAPSAAINNTPHCRLISWQTNGCPVQSIAARSSRTKVFPTPHCPDNRPWPTIGIRPLISHDRTGRRSGSPCAYIFGNCNIAAPSRETSTLRRRHFDCLGDFEVSTLPEPPGTPCFGA